jgi:Pyridine nucleotide-disulphide oxidoreductase
MQIFLSRVSIIPELKKEDGMAKLDDLPVAVIGGGPVGLAAAAHLIARGLPVRLFEAGARVGAHIETWGHVRFFSPWRYSVDPVARALLSGHGLAVPDDDTLPTGGELISRYLAPLAATLEMAAVIETGTRVTAISRQGIDKVVSKGREARPFVLSIETANGPRLALARAVIDATGTWSRPNPLGANGLPAAAEPLFSDRIAYGIPDVLGRDRNLYAGRKTLVVGAGHSAANALLDLSELADMAPGTEAIWATRGTNLSRVFGGGADDQLPARGELGAGLKALVESGRLALVGGFAITAVREEGSLFVDGDTAQGQRSLGPVDRIIAATGQRPDFDLTRELRLELDPWLECPRALGPLIDPNLHSCGSVPPHGHRELAHPEPGFYTVGIKSYGRAPTFLLLTGYEQVRSVAAAVAGDMAAANGVELVLPKTGVCSTRAITVSGVASADGCGSPVGAETDACRAAGVTANAAGKAGCGCKEAA